MSRSDHDFITEEFDEITVATAHAVKNIAEWAIKRGGSYRFMAEDNDEVEDLMVIFDDEKPRGRRN